MGQIEDLRLYVLVVDSGGISKAAEKMRIAKSAVSRRLGLLEDRYGAVLINRQPGAWNVTDIGRDLYQRAVEAVGGFDDIAADFSQTSLRVEGPLTISVPQEFGTAFLSPVLAEFGRLHPQIQIHIEFDNRPVELARENYDFAVRITPTVEDGTFATHIGTSRHHLYASAAYLDANGRPACVQDLRNHKLLNYGMTKRAAWNFDDINGKANRIAFKPAMSSNSGLFLVDAARRGLGITRLPDFVGRALCDRNDLVEVLPQLKSAPLNIYLIRDENRRLSRSMRAFSEYLEAACIDAGGA